jgi:hypothetical protein
MMISALWRRLELADFGFVRIYPGLWAMEKWV